MSQPPPATTPATATRRPAPGRAPRLNPIFRRYCRSRLRPQGLAIALLLTLIAATFLFLIIRSGAIYRAKLELADAERTPLIPLLVLQGIILFLLGTGQVAAGMTAEGDENVLDYQRLAPMTPLAKVLGYLFGLPVREYVCCLATMPFTLWALWRGQVEWVVALVLYAVFFSSAILYHLTGLVAGTVIRNRRWAFLVSMGLVFTLYTVMPQISNFGLVYFRYLTLQPVFEESVPHLIPRAAGATLLVGRALLGETRFFNVDLPEVVFTLLSQCVVGLTLAVMLWRRWRRPESHLLGKIWAIAVYAWIQVTLLGIALPRVDSGMLFPSREFTRRFGANTAAKRDWAVEPVEAVLMTAAVGAVSLVILWILTVLITPNAERQLRGWRRARKLGRHSLPWNSDPATSFTHVAIMAACGALGWFLFTRGIVESRWFGHARLSPSILAAFALVLFTGAMGFHALLEGSGGRATALCAILVGLVPVLLAAVLATITNRFAAPATWLGAISPLSAPLYAAAALVPVSELPLPLERAVPRAFWFSQTVAALLTLRLMVHLRTTRAALARKK